MPKENRPKQVPKRAKEAADPDFDMMPHVPEAEGAFLFSPERVQGAE
jgi:hypothetical protein